MNKLEHKIKAYLLEEWMPVRDEVGLQGLVKLAAKAAVIEVQGEMDCGHAEELEQLRKRVEYLTEALHFAELSLVKEEGENEGGKDSEELHIPDAITQYDCVLCGHSHKVDSRIGREHLPNYYREQVEANVEPVDPSDSASK